MSAVVQEPTPLVRPMREHDLPRIHTIESRSYDFPWSLGVFSDCLRVGYCCWTIESAHVTAGYAIMTVAVHEAHILNLCVDPHYRRLGYARALLAQVFDSGIQHGARSVYLEVRPSNRSALRLYESEGFTQIGRRPAYYPAQAGREDALVLSRKIAATC